MDEKERHLLIASWLSLAEEKIEVSHELLALSRFDDAISRAYYAMFYSAKAALLTIGFDPHSHSGVTTLFSQHFVKTGQASRQYSRILAKAMQARQTSDYNPITRASSEDAKQAITNAKAFLAEVKTLIN